MLTSTSRHRLSAVGIALAGVIALTSCAQPGATSDDAGLTLVESKAKVQLMRNNVANRIAEEDLAGHDASADFSVTCGSESTDPQGLTRYWTSRVDVALTEAHAAIDVFDELSVSLQHQGWKVETFELNNSPRAQLLKSGSSSTDLSLNLYEATDDKPAIIRIEAHGSCVKTAGAESDEVKQLEESAGN